MADMGDVTKGIIQTSLKGQCGRRYILGGENLSYRKIFTEIARALGVEPPRKAIPPIVEKMTAVFWEGFSCLTRKHPFITQDMAFFDNRYFFFDSQRAVKELNYTMTPFKESIRRCIEGYKRGGMLSK